MNSFCSKKDYAVHTEPEFNSERCRVNFIQYIFRNLAKQNMIPSITEHVNFKEQNKLKNTDKNVFHKLIVRFIAQNMLPISIVKSTAFREMIAFANSSPSPMIRQTAVKKIDRIYEEMNAKICFCYEKSKLFFTTADIWSTRHYSFFFFGYACHWLNENLKRTSVALACNLLYGSHNYELIHKTILQIHKQFRLDKNNVVARTTDNGSNFVKAFIEFGLKLTK